MTKDELIRCALDALEAIAWSNNTTWQSQRAKIEVDAIKEALAQPEQEPVAWMIWLHGQAGFFDHKQFAGLEFERRNEEYPDPDRKLLPLYTTPPHRKPLTDEEIDKLPWEPHEGNPMTFAEGLRYFARAIEAAHGIKVEA